MIQGSGLLLILLLPKISALLALLALHRSDPSLKIRLHFKV